MEELKSCLFCGRYIDRSFAYCPYCGFEFGRRDEAAENAEEPPVISSLDSSPQESGGEAPAAAENPDYLARLRDMQNRLIDMERELDLILSSSASLNRPERAEAKLPDKGRGSVGLPSHGQVTSSSKGP